jgi:hypothetical protein
MKPMSAASPRMMVLWGKEGEGQARWKAGLLECSEGLLLLLTGGQPMDGAWRPEHSVGGGPLADPEQLKGGAQAKEEGAGDLNSGIALNAWPGAVLGVPGGHRPWSSEERITLTRRSLVFGVHCVKKGGMQRSQEKGKCEKRKRKRRGDMRK